MKINRNILIAEDEQISFRLLSIIINHIDPNFNIFHGVNGLEAIDIFKEQKIDIILMDVKMPKMNGVEATLKIRQFDPNIPIIAQTAFTQEHEISLIKDAGVNEVMAKPITKDGLAEVFKKYLR
jgi:CheY-like chemotaxis protein